MRDAEKLILETVRTLFRIQRQPVKTRLIVEHLGDIPSRTVRYHLTKLEREGWLERPNGSKRGYAVVPAPRRLLNQQLACGKGILDLILKALRKLYNALGCPVPTKAIVAQIVPQIVPDSISRWTVWRHLVELETMGHVCHKGKSGWLLAQNAA